MSKVLKFILSNTWLDSCFDQPEQEQVSDLPAKLNREFLRKKDASVEKRYRGFTIQKNEQGEYFSSLDPESTFDTLQGVKSLIDWYVKGRAA